MNFKEGQEVVCIDAKTTNLINGNHYTIRKIEYLLHGAGLVLNEIEPPLPFMIGYHIWRFAPLTNLYAENKITEKEKI